VRQPVIAYIGLGSNLGDRAGTLNRAVEMIAALPQTRLLRTSSWLENPAVGIPDGPNFLNGAAEIETSLTPCELLRELQEIEKRSGRVRPISNTPHPNPPPQGGRGNLAPSPLAGEGWGGGDLRSIGSYQSRTLDLDILLYGDQVIHEEGLVIPHPRMREREFVMKPLAELLKRVE
jgi:2-amino-4-hydroxy-6-hydroxymethyldihydropteridine diphosphokinase